MQKDIVNAYYFETKNRKLLTFSDPAKIRLNDDDRVNPVVALKQLPDNTYSTDDDITVTTWEKVPKGLKQIKGFEAVVDLPAGTTIQHRVITDGNEKWWDGANWVPPGLSTDWNDGQTIQDNISSLVVGSDKRVAVKSKLKTTDPNVTPQLIAVKFLGAISIEWWDDIIYDTVVRRMRESLRATTVIQIAVVNTTSVIDLSTDYKLENSGYNFTAVQSAFNLSTDPDQLTNIATGYTPGPITQDGTYGPGQISLSGAVNAGEVLRIVMEYEPEVAVFTDQDFYEVARLPAIVFERIRTVRGHKTSREFAFTTADGEHIRDLAAGTVVRNQAPRQSTIRFEYAMTANKNSDLARLADAMDRFMAQNRLMTTWALGEQVVLDPVDEIETRKDTDLDGVYTATGMFQLLGVPFYLSDNEDLPLVLQVNTSFSQNTE